MMNEEGSLKLIQAVTESFKGYFDSRLKLFSSQMFKLLNNFVGNVRTSNKQFFFNTEIKNQSVKRNKSALFLDASSASRRTPRSRWRRSTSRSTTR